MVYIGLIGLIAVFVVVLTAMLAMPLRRAWSRAAEKNAFAKELERKMILARSLPGASALNPIVIATPALVEAKAEGTSCLRCGTQMRLEDHAAKKLEERRLRVAKLRCPRCEAEREIYFELVQPS